ncbi:hypothetical protein DL95DRAFT_455145 [Leptodontidium sp. 2 PMI_412]|nr:hypothetical protein DL95DRAFT_455145 [Leptodontidium sp. 2 PMI_412]
MAALLPFAAMSTPLIAVRDADAGEVVKGFVAKTAQARNEHKMRDLDAEAVGLVKRANQFCDIVNVVTEVDCWILPKHGGNGNRKVKSLAGTRNNVEFSCYTDCEDVGGNTSWDWAVNHGCYIPGFYTDATCTRRALGKCPWFDSDRAFGGCA